MMCSWHQLGDYETEKSNTEPLARLCSTDLASARPSTCRPAQAPARALAPHRCHPPQGELFLCKSTLIDHFNTVFNKPEERDPGADSPDVIHSVDLQFKAPVPVPVQATSTVPSGYTFSPVDDGRGSTSRSLNKTFSDIPVSKPVSSRTRSSPADG